MAIQLAALTVAMALLFTDVGMGQSIPRLPEPHAVPLANPGEGANLIVTGGPELCHGEDMEMIVRRSLIHESTIQYVGRRPIQPSCYWEFHDLLPGLYDALIHTRSGEMILATGEVELAPGSTMGITLEPLDLEVEGRVTIGGVHSRDLLLTFRTNTLPLLDWNVAIGGDGSYRTRIRSSRLTCARVERKQAFNTWSHCESFLPGLRQLDLDIPPGVIRIEVPAVSEAPEDAQLLIEVASGSGAWSRSVFVARGFQGEFFGQGYGRYQVTLKALDDHTTRAASAVILSPERPDALVVLGDARR